MTRVPIIIIFLTILSCGQQDQDKSIFIDQAELTKTKKELQQLSVELTSTKKQLQELSIERDSIKEDLRDLTIRFKSLIHLSTGAFRYTDNKNSDTYGENYRVEIYQSEIYRSLYVTKIEHYGEGRQRLSWRAKLDFENITGKTEEQTATLDFVRWVDFDKFQIESNDNNFHIEIFDSNSFKVTED